MSTSAKPTESAETPLSEVKVKIHTEFSDGTYYYRQLAPTDKSTDFVEVAQTTVDMWEAINEAFDRVQKQLRELDNELFDREDKKRKEQNG